MVLLVAFLLLVAVLVSNALLLSSRQISPSDKPTCPIPQEQALQRLSQAVQCQTISFEDPQQIQWEQFTKFHAFLETAYPNVHKTLEKEVVNGYSLLYTWPGSDTSQLPILLMAHMDVVPIENEASWEYPPFAGTITQEHIWGRGTMDDKGMILSILEAAELLIQQGFSPKRTIYFAFGHDEELGGSAGTAHIVELLKQRKVQLEYVLDEGLAVTQDIVPGITKPVALIAVSEKGCVSLKLTVSEAGGHSSMPPKETAIGIICRAVARIQAKPFSAKLKRPTLTMFEYLAPEMAFPEKLAISNLWLLSPVVTAQLQKSPTTNATLRTTTAPTIIQGGTKDNVLPAQAEAIINFRIYPGETCEYVKEYITKVVKDPRVTIEFYGEATDPSPISSDTSVGFQDIHFAIKQVFPESIVAPGLMVGQSDSRHYASISKDVYRFAPMHMFPDDPQRIHGSNERLTIVNYMQCIEFFFCLMQNSAGK